MPVAGRTFILSHLLGQVVAACRPQSGESEIVGSVTKSVVMCRKDRNEDEVSVQVPPQVALEAEDISFQTLLFTYHNTKSREITNTCSTS
jgi:hypothetical protein